MPNALLARSAENIFWLARYIERAENLARILDVHATFSRDSRGGQTWLPVLQLNADEARFFKTHDTASAEKARDQAQKAHDSAEEAVERGATE